MIMVSCINKLIFQNGSKIPSLPTLPSPHPIPFPYNFHPSPLPIKVNTVFQPKKSCFTGTIFTLKSTANISQIEKKTTAK
jgi:hypothetical protein